MFVRFTNIAGVVVDVNVNHIVSVVSGEDNAIIRTVNGEHTLTRERYVTDILPALYP